MKPICIALNSGEILILYNKELNNLFDELKSKLIGSGADLIYLQNNKIIPLLEKVLPKSLGISAISREDLILIGGPEDFQLQSVKFFIYYNNGGKKYTIKFL